MDDSLDNKITELVESKGYLIYDIERVTENYQRIYRVSIMKAIKQPNDEQDNITLQDCELINNLISPIIDMYNIEIDHLEVSSKGLDRQLNKPRHFKLSLNERVKIKLNDKAEQKTIEGIIKSADDEKLILQITTQDTAEDKAINYTDIKKAKVIFIWK